MSPVVQNRNDTLVGDGHDEHDLDCIPAVKVGAAHLIALDRIELLFSVTGEAEAGSAGEQPRGIAGWRLTPMDREPIGTDRLPPLAIAKPPSHRASG